MYEYPHPNYRSAYATAHANPQAMISPKSFSLLERKDMNF
jgi:hypothetical protein